MERLGTRKVPRGGGAVVAGGGKERGRANLHAARDGGFARDYVEAMWMMVQQPERDDYIITTGDVHTVRDFLEATFAMVGLD